jgi:hypothetical protein
MSSNVRLKYLLTGPKGCPFSDVAARLAGLLLRCKMAIVACATGIVIWCFLYASLRPCRSHYPEFRAFVILNLFQDNILWQFAILTQVQDDEGEG